MASNEQIKQRIDDIDELLASGVTSVSTDGTSTSIDVNSLRKERADLNRRLISTSRPLNMNWNLGGVRK
jgi:hypothetical protein